MSNLNRVTVYERDSKNYNFPAFMGEWLQAIVLLQMAQFLGTKKLFHFDGKTQEIMAFIMVFISYCHFFLFQHNFKEQKGLLFS